MYNDNCILDISTNTVIFDFDNEWDIYLDWKSKNQESDTLDFNKRKNTLLWNSGLSYIENDTESFYDDNGILFKKIDNNTTTYYNKDGIYKVELTENNLLVKAEYYSGSDQILFKEIDYKLNVEKIFSSETGNILYYKKIKGKLEYEVHYYQDNTRFKSILKKSNKLLKLTQYYNTNVISKKLSYIGNDMYRCSTYYISGKLRGAGVVSENDKMQGEWIFYHHNTNIESTHEFKNSKFIGKSSLFYEDGNLYREINHD